MFVLETGSSNLQCCTGEAPANYISTLMSQNLMWPTNHIRLCRHTELPRLVIRLSHSNDRAARLRVVCPSFLFVFIFDRSHFQKALTVDQSMCLEFQVLTIFSHSFRVNHCSSFSGSGCLSAALQRHYALFKKHTANETYFVKILHQNNNFFFLTTLLGNITQDNNMGLKTFFFSQCLIEQNALRFPNVFYKMFFGSFAFVPQVATS